MENTFWNSTDGNLVEMFKKSFTLYVDSGMKKTTEAVIDELRIQDGGYRTQEFMAEFCKLIIDHCLCKLLCFYLCSYI
jgi:hypothetical protein